MKIALNEKQYDLLLSNLPDDQEISEIDSPTTTPSSTPSSSSSSSTTSTPTSNVDAKGVSSSGDKVGYPNVSKWSDIVGSKLTRGPGNQIANTKWSDIVGSLISRGAANQLSEQPILPKNGSSLNLNNFEVLGPFVWMENQLYDLPKPFTIEKDEQVSVAFYIKNNGNENVKIVDAKTEENNTYRLLTNTLENLKIYQKIIEPKKYSIITYDIVAKEKGNILPTTFSLSVLLEKVNTSTNLNSFDIRNKSNQIGLNLPNLEVNVPYPILRKYGLFENHTVNMILQLGAFCIPVAGWAALLISGGIGLMDAKQYYDEGDTKSAGLSVLFSLLPAMSKIPGVKQLGAKGLKVLEQKIIRGETKLFTNLEKEVMVNVAHNQQLIKNNLNVMVKNAASKASLSQKIGSLTKKGLINLSKFGIEGAFIYGTAKTYDKIYDYLTKTNKELINSGNPLPPDASESIGLMNQVFNKNADDFKNKILPIMIKYGKYDDGDPNSISTKKLNKIIKEICNQYLKNPNQDFNKIADNVDKT